MYSITISLPWPPTANTYWRRRGNVYFISPKGIAYRRHVMDAMLSSTIHFGSDVRIRMHVECFPPDKRRRDLDNLGKSLLDSLQHANVYVDDSQIDYLCFERMPGLFGKVLVHLSCI